MRRRVLAATLAAVLAAGSLAACGESAPDLFLVTRSGNEPGAHLTLVVSDDGHVRCNGGPPKRMTDEELLVARDLARQLAKPASEKVSLPPTKNTVFTYQVRSEKGTVEFSDTSRPAKAVFLGIAGLTRSIASTVCGLAT